MGPVFQDVKQPGIYGCVFYTVPHLALGWVGYLLYSHFCFPAPAVLALLIPLLGILKAVRMLDENKEKLWARIRKLG